MMAVAAGATTMVFAAETMFLSPLQWPFEGCTAQLPPRAHGSSVGSARHKAQNCVQTTPKVPLRRWHPNTKRNHRLRRAWDGFAVAPIDSARADNVETVSLVLMGAQDALHTPESQFAALGPTW
jgi:hypothetical protein